YTKRLRISTQIGVIIRCVCICSPRKLVERSKGLPRGASLTHPLTRMVLTSDPVTRVNPGYFSPLPKVHNAALQGPGRGLRPIGYTQFAEDVVDVTLDRGFADRKHVGDLFVALAVDDLPEHLQLATGQFRRTHPGRQALRHGTGNQPRARMDLSDGR